MDVSEKNTYPRTHPLTDKAILETLTDSKVADDLRDIVEGTIATDREPDMALLRYIKLNNYERQCNKQNGTLEDTHASNR